MSKNSSIVKCEICNIEFSRRNGELNRNKKLGRKIYCSLRCSSKALYEQKLPKHKRTWKHLALYKKNQDEYSKFRLMFRTAKSRAKFYQREFNITLDDMKNLWEKQQGICPYTGWKLVLPENSSKLIKSPDRASLDRIDSSKGYTVDNIQFVCLSAQFAKLDFTEEEFLKFCYQIAKHYKHKV